MSDVNTQSASAGDDGQISLVEIMTRLKAYKKYLLKNWILVSVFLLAGVIGGVLRSVKSDPLYVAETTFVLDQGDNKMPNIGLASLALGANKAADLFNETSNIMWLYSTKLMIRKTLLTEVDSFKTKTLLVNWLIAGNQLQKKFDKNPALKNVHFKAGITDSTLSLQQNMILGTCVDLIRAKYLGIGEIKKTENIISVSISSKDELFAKAFAEQLVNNVNTYYIDTKTHKAAQEVNTLQQKADSFRKQMDVSMFQATRAVDAVPNANPMQQVLRVEPQRKQIDVQVSSTIYIEIMKNLEASKLALAKQTPIIQVIEEPVLPLSTKKPSLVLSVALGLILAFLAVAFVLEVKRRLTKQKQVIVQN